MTAKDPLVYSDPTRATTSVGALSYQHGNTAISYSHVLSRWQCSVNTSDGGEPITHSGRDGGRKIIYTGVWRDGEYVIATNTPRAWAPDIDATAIGARLHFGAHQI